MAERGLGLVSRRTDPSLVPSPTSALHFVTVEKVMLEAEAVGWERDYTDPILASIFLL